MVQIAANTFNDFALDIHEANVNAGWWTNINTGESIDRNIGELLMLCVSELAEAMEGDRKNLMDNHLPEYKMFDVEIADTFIRLFDIAGKYIPNIGDIINDKLNYNARREDHKIKNRLEGGKKY